jgi:hypothetical protein
LFVLGADVRVIVLCVRVFLGGERVCCYVIRKVKRLIVFNFICGNSNGCASPGRQEERRLERERMREEREAALQREREEEARRRAEREEAEALARQRAEEERQRCDVAPCALPAEIAIAGAPVVVSHCAASLHLESLVRSKQVDYLMCARVF